jgi:hypothetical protein
MFMLKTTHARLLEDGLACFRTRLADVELDIAQLRPFEIARQIQYNKLSDENDALKERLARTVAEKLVAQTEADRLKPAADKWNKAQSRRMAARKVAK